MVTLSEVRDWLKSFNLFQNYYIGRLDSKKKYSLGVYNLADGGRRETFGCLKAYDKKGISLLIYGDGNKATTEKLAWKLYTRLEEIVTDNTHTVIGKTDIFFIELLQNQPVDVDQDDAGIYEYVIELNIYSKR